MKKIYFLITILVFSFLSLSTLSSLTYSSNPLVVECSVEGKILDLDDEKIVVQIFSFEILFDKDECPVERGDTYEITYTINNAEDLTLTEDGIFTANVGRFWTTPQPGKSPVLLNWYNIKDSENSIVPLINPQSDVLPIDTQNLDEEDVETTIIDEYTKVVSNRYFDLTLERKQQSGFGNNVPYILTVIPHIDSRRTQIIWNVPAALGVKPRHKEFVNLTKGETYTFKANIKPMKSGTYDFSVSAIAWEHDTNYTNAISDRVQFDSNLVLQPVSTHYQRTNTLKFALLFTFFLVSCFVVIRIFMKISPKMKDWLTPPPM